MKIKNILITLLLLSPVISWAQGARVYPQSGTEEGTNFVEIVIKKVEAYNTEIDKLSKALNTAKANKSTDSVIIKEQRKEAVKKCFQVPQDYIKANPSSPYSCQALSMLGKGEPGYPVSVPDLERLFNSLAPELRNSNAGKAYAEQLASWKERNKKN